MTTAICRGYTGTGSWIVGTVILPSKVILGGEGNGEGSYHVDDLRQREGERDVDGQVVSLRGSHIGLIAQ